MILFLYYKCFLFSILRSLPSLPKKLKFSKNPWMQLGFKPVKSGLNSCQCVWSITRPQLICTSHYKAINPIITIPRLFDIYNYFKLEYFVDHLAVIGFSVYFMPSIFRAHFILEYSFFIQCQRTLSAIYFSWLLSYCTKTL